MVLWWLVLGVFGCGDRAHVGDPLGGDQRPDVVLITLDTTRADRIGAYGYSKARTVHLDALAAAGRRYERAYSPAPHTIPAHASLFTGRYPASLGIRDNGDAVLAEEADTLAEHLKRAGYATVASTGAFVTSARWGFDQGFDAYFDELGGHGESWHAERPADAVVDDIERWLRRRTATEPVFAWVHLFDPHLPYVQPPQPGEHLYDAEVAFMDAQIGRLRDLFDSRPVLFVVVGDHGEGLGDHQELTHGLYTWETTQRVPLVLSGQGVATEVVEGPVSLVDVAPILLKVLQLRDLPEGEGQPDPAADRPIYMESWELHRRFGLAPHRAVVVGPHKLIDLPRPELYDVVQDPAETQNLAAEDPQRVVELHRVLEDMGFGPPLERQRVHAAELELLGYVDGGFLGEGGEPADPKDSMGMLKLTQRMAAHRVRGEHDQANEILQALAVEHPDVVEFQTDRARILSGDGDWAGAERVLRQVQDRSPNHELVNLQLADVLLSGFGRDPQRLAEACARLDRAAEALPQHPNVRSRYVRCLFTRGDEGSLARAVEVGQRYLQERPDDHRVQGVLGPGLVKLGEVEQGMALVRKASLADRPEREVSFLLAAEAVGSGRLEEALGFLDRELQQYPDATPAAVARVRLLVQMGRNEQAVEVAPAVAAGLAPQDRSPVLHAMAQAQFNLGAYGEARTTLDSALGLAADDPQLLLLDANLLQAEGLAERARARFEEAKAARQRTAEP